MKTKTLAGGLEVSALCFGIMNLGVVLGKDESYALLDRYFEAGGRFVDTANNYGSWNGSTRSGDSERLLGSWIADRGVAGEIVVATKCGADRLVPDRPLGMAAPTNFEGLTPEVVRAELEGSLERLGLARVGVYYGHVDDRNLPVTQIADTFSALVEDGLTSVVGLSNAATWRLAIAREHSRAQGRPAFGAWQQEHSIYWPRPGLPTTTLLDTEGLDYAAEQPDLTVMTYSPNQKGQLVRPWLPTPAPYDHPGSAERLRKVHAIAHELGVTANQVALAWHLAGPLSRMERPAGSDRSALAELPERRVSMVPVVGASSIGQLEESIGALEVELSPEHRAVLDNI
ncbi:aldo/keto reductase [Kineosporia succinea]|uniref:Aryl-alcohol dehydrogenase-like predicted oxidoreductase n=1 Tax=Kineosporia succinea TaxID=84632 RepID=A0ABT9PCP8_9ACTN|nr:aldo/keto reductase [Kineosporia succinea]MDP9830488.1 aryl-alcohol dehydrogenase-like predicted oxidoreductase [Kineosporia succinea]